MNAGVPMVMPVTVMRLSRPSSFAIPKSRTFTKLSPSLRATKMLSGLMSRCTIPSS
jgi:hypothetical protein